MNGAASVESIRNMHGLIRSGCRISISHVKDSIHCSAVRVVYIGI